MGAGKLTLSMRRETVLSVVVALLVLGAGCQALGSDAQRSDEAEAALADAQSALEDVRTYRTDTSMEVSAVADGESLERDVTVEGVVNASQQRLRTTARMEDRSSTSYVDNRTAYRACGGMAESWSNESFPVEESWIDGTPAGRQLGLLEDGDLRVANSSGAPDGTTVLVGEPSPSAVEDYQEDRAQPVFGGSALENISVRVVIDGETRLPRRSIISLDVSAGGGSGSVTMETEYTAYNDPVRIDIPSEVREHSWETGCPG